MKEKTLKLITALRIDPIILGLSAFLLLIGAVFVFEASVVEAYHQFGDELHFVRHQFQWILIGFVFFSLVMFTPSQVIYKFTNPAFFLSLILLFMVLIPGFGSNIKGASRWLDIGGFSFQPTEVIKITLTLFLAKLFEKKPDMKKFIFWTGLVIFLVMLQPDLGTSIVIGSIAMIIFFIAGAKLTQLASLFGLAVLAVVVLVFGSDYRRRRLLTFLKPDHDPLGSSYHIRQILIALGSGQISGRGLGKSLQKYRFLPEATTDSIFAVIAEETGFLGSSIIIFTYLLFSLRGFKIASDKSNNYIKFSIVGLTSIIFVQAFLNLSAMVSIVPLTGITLPLISYGGSSLVSSMITIGLIINLSRVNK